MKVAVRPSVAIPHVVYVGGKNYAFTPVCENLPDDYAKGLVANAKKQYFEVTDETKIDLEQYRVTDKFQMQSLEDIYKAMSPENKVAVLEFARNLARGKQATKPEVVVDKQTAVDEPPKETSEEVQMTEQTEVSPKRRRKFLD